VTPTHDRTDDLAVLTPSFRGDVELFADLHASVLAHTPRSVVHHVVVPPSDAHLFRQYEGPRCRVWTHRDLLPRYCVSVPYASGLTLSLRQPWLPVRGWVVQQIMKLAGTAAIDARAVVIIDSDAVLLREITLDHFTDNGRLWHFRRNGAVTASMHRHLLWHNVARKLLGLRSVESPPAPDYVSPITVWDPTVVRPLIEHIADRTRRDWIDAMGGQLHVSEFVIYGVFIDEVLGGIAPFAGPLCHNYYERTPLSAAGAGAFADQMPSRALGAMISSHSHTPRAVRLEAFRRCGEIAQHVASHAGPAGAVDQRVAFLESAFTGRSDAAGSAGHPYTRRSGLIASRPARVDGRSRVNGPVKLGISVTTSSHKLQ
jgi:hypothetical protein